jgi:signal transduction histidine kinase
MLIVLLAMLQYRWLGQVSESERQDLRHSFERRAQDFAAEADNESGGLYQAFTSLVDGSDTELAADIGTHLATWQKANRYPALVRALFVIRTRGPHDAVLHFDPARRTLDEIPVPAEIVPVFDRLRFGASGIARRGEQSYTQVAIIGGSSFISRIPARLVWLWPKWPSAVGTPTFPRLVGNVVARAPLTERVLLIQLDRTVMVHSMLPAMLVNHFGEGPRTGTLPEGHHPDVLPPRLYERGSPVRLQIVDAESSIVVAAGMRPGESFPADSADVAVPFFGTEDTWHLLVQHGAGSLDQAVALTRRRNLYVSVGILSVLVVAMGLVVGNARRTERLAGQQMEFVAAVSHELRTPIAVIRSAAENLSSGIVQELPQAKQYGEAIEAEGRRLTDMVEQVLEHANIRGTRMARRRVDVDVRDLVQEVVRACEPMTSGAGITVEVEVSPDLPHVPADEAALRRALENLIGNAVKHAGAGRWIGVSARLLPNGSARVVDRRPGRTARTRPLRIVDISVSDRGPGVSRDERGRIFEAFYRGRLALDRQVPGTGLGLSLVKRILEDHGGSVEAKAMAGGGATFSMRLPVLPDPDVVSAAGDACR